MEKYSRQKEAILMQLRSRCDHPTAEELFASLKKDMPGLSLATVYRNLTKLSQKGEIAKLGCKHSGDRFDANTNVHGHFLCECCGRLIDLDIPTTEHIGIESLSIKGVVHSYDLIVNGICEYCVG